MVEALLLAAAVSLPPKGEFDSAYRAAKGAVLNANLLMTSAQARVKRLQLAFDAAGAAALKARAQSSFDSLSARMSAFRAAADSLDARRPGVDSNLPSPSKAASAQPVTGATGDLLSEIAELRRGYDDAAGKRSLDDVRRAFKRWGAKLPELAVEQERALTAARAIALEARRAAKILAPKAGIAPDAFDAAGRETKGLIEDAAALETELELIGARYRLDNLLKAHPELGGA